MVSPNGVLAAEWTLASTSFVFLILRFYVKRYIVHVGIQREDILLAFAQMLFFCWVSLDAYTISKGFMSNGRSYFDNFVIGLRYVEHLSDPEIIKILKIVYSSATPYYLGLWIIKFAILGLYFRIVPKHTKSRRFLIFTTFYTLFTGICVLLVNVVLCIPVSLNWSLDHDTACYASTAVTPFVISVLFNLSTDVLIFIVPFPVVRSLKSLNQKQKIGLIVTFSLGAITIIVCLARAAVIGSTGSISSAAALTAAENFTALLVAALPALRPLLKTRPFRRRERKSDMSANEENMTVSDMDSRHHDFAPQGLPPRQFEKTLDGSLPPLPSAFTTEIQPSGNSYVAHQQHQKQPPTDQAYVPTHGGSRGGSGGYNSYSSQSHYSTGGYQTTSPTGIRHDEFSLREHLGNENDFEDIEEYNHGERVQLVSLNTRMGAISPTRYENYYGRRALSPLNTQQLPPAPPPGYPHQNMFIPDSPLPPVPQHNQPHPTSGDPFMPDYLHDPAPNPTI
ncbi:hypothetical protein TRVA0_001S03862 [Trichomonascus vanleenenianus]|uniref:uncharacterized protein n=1 Tax=Trichomonascus vanleenenianus TaxID=2268995 RepID=UPI003EC99BD2